MGFILGKKNTAEDVVSYPSAVGFSIAFLRSILQECGSYFIEQVFYNVNHGKLSSVLKLHAPTEILREIVRFIRRVRILPYNAFRRWCP